MPLIIPATQTLAAGGYDIDNSCRFDRASSAYMSISSLSGGSTTTGTQSWWFKRAGISTDQRMWAGYGGSASARNQIGWQAADKLYIQLDGGTMRISTQVFRDVSAWYHIVCAWDTTQGSASDRLHVYLNGTEITTWDTNATIGSSADIRANNAKILIGQRETSSLYFDGYLAEFHSVDGTQLDADDFGERGDYGEWKPIAYSGSYGTNGFYLDFADAADLGDDESGNGRDFTETNLAASDQTTDTPTNNWAVANSLPYYPNAITSFSEGNLQFVMNASASYYGWGESTIGMSSGKWYCEAHVTWSTNAVILGIVGKNYNNADTASTNYVGGLSDTYGWYKNQGIYNNASATSYGSNTIASGDVVGIALDLDNNKLYFHQNGTYLASGDPAGNSNGHTIAAASTTRSGYYFFAFGTWGEGCTWTCNYGQDGTLAGNKTAGGNADDNGYGNFLYDVPAGFLALCSKNMEDSAVTPSEHFNTILYDDGAGAKTGVGFQPDLVWVKSRGSAYSHKLTDAVRGVTKALSSDAATAEVTEGTGLTAFGADGFTVGADTDYSDTTGDGMVAWCWKAGNSSGSSNGDGTITSTVTVNSDAKFSIVKWAGDSSESATVGHGLGVIPSLVICHEIDGADWWHVRTNDLATTCNMFLNETNASRTDNDVSGHIADLTSTTVFGFTSSGGGTYDNVVAVNESGKNNIAYCWAEVEGFSKIGAYDANGSADGNFIYTGFSPEFVLIKPTNIVQFWELYDKPRQPINPRKGIDALYPSSNIVEGGGDGADSNYIDFLSNGFKPRSASGDANATNNSSGNYLYIAFASVPYKNSNAV